MKKTKSNVVSMFKYILFLFLIIPQPTIGADLFAEKEPIVLTAGGQQWTISVEYDAPHARIRYQYLVDDQLQQDDVLPSETYSDSAPVAILFSQAPLVVWSGIATKTGDSDLYFSYWDGRYWSLPQLVHTDNTAADMSPQLSLSDDGTPVLSWLRNTGDQIIHLQATFANNAWSMGQVKSASSQIEKSALTKSSTYYSSLTARDPSEPFRCVALGDSITAGCYRDASHNTNYWCSHDRNGETTGGYVDPLQELLQSVHAQSLVYNYGHPGELSYEGADRIAWVLNQKTDANCILIMFGANDRIMHAAVSDTRANIQYMANYARSRGVIPIIATITPNSLSSVVDYNTEIVDLANDTGLTLADQYSATVTNWSDYHSGDGLHLNDTGNAVVGQQWYDTMRTNTTLFLPAIVPYLQPLLLSAP